VRGNKMAKNLDTGDREDLLTVCDMWRSGSGGAWEEE